MKIIINNSFISTFKIDKLIRVCKLNFGSQHLVAAIGVLMGVLIGFNYEIKKILKKCKIFVFSNCHTTNFLMLKKTKIKTLSLLHKYFVVVFITNLLLFKIYLEINICKINYYFLVLKDNIKNFATIKNIRLIINKI